MENKDKIYKELENYAQEQKQAAQFRPLSPRKRRKFPLNFILMLALLGFFFYLWQDGSLTYNPKNPDNKPVPSFIAKLLELAAHNKLLYKYVSVLNPQGQGEVQAAPVPSREVAGLQSPDDPNYIPTDDDIRLGRWVQISGKYFKYSPDHIYYVSGVKTFYVNNHKAPEPPPAPKN